MHAATSCDVSISRFPFDSQSCYLEFMFMEVNNVDVVLNVSSQVVQENFDGKHQICR